MADTSLRQRFEFPEVKGKTLSGIEVSSDSEYFGITVSFQDKTALTFTVEPRVAVFPVLADWTNGEEKIVKNYRAVRSRNLKT